MLSLSWCGAVSAARVVIDSPLPGQRVVSPVAVMLRVESTEPVAGWELCYEASDASPHCVELDAPGASLEPLDVAAANETIVAWLAERGDSKRIAETSVQFEVSCGEIPDNLVRMWTGPLVDARRTPGSHSVRSGSYVNERDEEAWFHEVVAPVALSHRRRLGGRATMLELGAFWSYYSLIFVGHARASGIEPSLTLVEPTPWKRDTGRGNFAANEYCDVDVIWTAAAICAPGNTVFVDDYDNVVNCTTVDDLMRWRDLDVLHADIQGAELDMLAQAPLDRVHQIVLATHSSTLHADCRRVIADAGFVLARDIPCDDITDGYIHAIRFTN